MLPQKRRICDSEIVIITYIVVVSSVGVKRVDCTKIVMVKPLGLSTTRTAENPHRSEIPNSSSQVAETHVASFDVPTRDNIHKYQRSSSFVT